MPRALVDRRGLISNGIRGYFCWLKLPRMHVFTMFSFIYDLKKYCDQHSVCSFRFIVDCSATIQRTIMNCSLGGSIIGLINTPMKQVEIICYVNRIHLTDKRCQRVSFNLENSMHTMVVQIFV